MESRLKRRLFDVADLKGKKDPQITQITQISVCDCSESKAKRTEFGTDLFIRLAYLYS